MLTMDREKFEGDRFAVQVITKGAFVDDCVGNGKTYIIEATTLRVNWVAMRDWHSAHTSNCRDCYEDGPIGDKEWKGVLAKNKADLEAFENKIKEALGIDADKSIMVSQIQHVEVFTVVNIYEA